MKREKQTRKERRKHNKGREERIQGKEGRKGNKGREERIKERKGGKDPRKGREERKQGSKQTPVSGGRALEARPTCWFNLMSLHSAVRLQLAGPSPGVQWAW